MGKVRKDITRREGMDIRVQRGEEKGERGEDKGERERDEK